MRKLLFSLWIVCATASANSWLYIPNATFSPVSICQTLFLRGDLGITKDGSDLVSTWADQSGSGNDFTSSSTFRPLWEASTLNGQNGVLFGSGKMMAGPATAMINVNSAVDVVLVFRLVSGPTGFPTILNLKTGAGANTTPNYYMFSSEFAVGAGVGNFRSARARYLPAGPNSYRYLKISFFGDGTKMTFDENGTVVSNGTLPDTGSGADDNVLGALQTSGTSSAPWEIQEVCLHPGTFSTPEWNNYKAYMLSRYALP